MTEIPLISAVELSDPDSDVGFRLARLEMYNWGTFHDQVWSFEPGGANGLLTGDIGSGKSTIVDAVTTLLLPAHRIAYNKAAGAESRERTLQTYVLGQFKSERNEETGTTRAVSLRSAATYSVLLARFVNTGFEQVVTLAQIFRARDGKGQPDRFFVVSDQPLTISADFSGFGSDLNALRRRLRAVGSLYDSYPQYGTDLRRRLGIGSEQALELFHQTVSMKSVGNLNEFVRAHMLEPFDASSRIDAVVRHFGDLTKAHESVVRAKDQIAMLGPILAECDAYDEAATQSAQRRAEQAGLDHYVAGRTIELLDRQIAELDEQLDRLSVDGAALDASIAELEDRRDALQLERAGLGGDRLATLEGELKEQERQRERRHEAAAHYDILSARAGLPPLGSPGALPMRLRDVTALAERCDADDVQLSNARVEHGVRLRGVADRSAQLQAEISSLQGRRSSIPSRSLAIRERLCADLGIDEDTLPFVGELVTVRPESRDWEGAAERVLHGFALSLLVPSTAYTDVAAWVDRTHLGARLVYFQVTDRVRPVSRTGDDLLLVDHLLVRDDSPFGTWVEAELAERAGQVCVDSTAEFRRNSRAVTRSGQIKDRHRHEKDDRSRIDDRARYVLGWDNTAKAQALAADAGELNRELLVEQKAVAEIADQVTAVRGRRDALAKLAEYTDPSQLDWAAAVTAIESLRAEKQTLESGNSALGDVNRRLALVDDDLERDRRRRRELDGDVRSAQDGRAAHKVDLDRARTLWEDRDAPDAGLLERYATRDWGSPRNAQEWERAGSAAFRELAAALEALDKRSQRHAAGAVARMAAFRQRYPQETKELDASIDAAAGYRDLHQRVAQDDLPRFEEDFRTSLRTETLREIAAFKAELERQADLINGRVATINESLQGIDYNEGRYIRLVPARTTAQDIREFKAELTEVAGDILDVSASEQKFLQVKRIIERFVGREGSADADRVWTRRVTDVRNWFVFTASERWRATDEEHESYSDSGGKSGGQKEKLAYTILAASLAYQFKIDWGVERSRTFRFVVIDEAFGKGSDESTRYALDLFGRLGLQLMIVTPLTKIHVIDPYVRAVGFVDNPTGAYSRIQTLTIEEYRERRQTWIAGA